MKTGPPSLAAGKTLTISAPCSTAAKSSVGVAPAGMARTPASRGNGIRKPGLIGETKNFAPAVVLLGIALGEERPGSDDQAPVDKVATHFCRPWHSPRQLDCASPRLGRADRRLQRFLGVAVRTAATMPPLVTSNRSDIMPLPQTKARGPRCPQGLPAPATPAPRPEAAEGTR